MDSDMKMMITRGCVGSSEVILVSPTSMSGSCWLLVTR